ncbi:MAG: serine hydrolase [Clostridia bacterium]|nr:serine hydrolase [Clostridia bacterium]
MDTIYVKNGISKKAICDFLINERDNCLTEIHAFSVIRRGELLCRFALPPYETTDCKQLFSLSKSFCSTAVGFAVDEGLFKVTDRIIDIFPECCPEVISERLAKMTVHNALTMGTGHGSCAMNVMIYSDNPVRAFMEKELVYEPGEKFVYNTGATLLLSIIVQKFTGKTVYDYLYEKLFRFLDNYPEKWDVIPAGYCEGGVGLYAAVRDIENLGMLYLGKGILNGKRYLSEEWVEMATSKQISNDGNGSPDWCAGYGYQFWRNSREGFRGDGAFGQYCFVLPESEIVVAVQCECTSAMQSELDGVFEYLGHIDDADDMTDAEFEAFIKGFYTPEKCEIGGFAGFGNKYALSDNAHNVKYVEFIRDGEKIDINLIGLSGRQTISAGNGEYITSSADLRAFKPTLNGLVPVRLEECRVACYVAECTENALTLKVRYRNAPQTETITFTEKDGRVEILYGCKTGNVIEEAKGIYGKLL